MQESIQFGGGNNLSVADLDGCAVRITVGGDFKGELFNTPEEAQIYFAGIKTACAALGVEWKVIEPVG